MTKNAIFIAATGQNVGKTTLCLGIIAGMKKRYAQVGFIKPIGQQHLKINQSTDVDKDAVLFKRHFKLEAEWSDMSPVIIPSGFTRDYIDEKISSEILMEKVQDSFKKISLLNDYTVVEGTGHVGVGSIIELNNAKIAATLGLDMVIIASGGLGSTYDELALNLAMCERYGVKVRGVILNRVLQDKRTMIESYFPRALKHWDVPLIGCVPYNEFLNMPTVKDFETLFNSPLLSGNQHHYRHFNDFRLVAGSAEAYKEEICPKVLVITPATREDIILATIEKQKAMQREHGIDYEGGIILTGQQPPSEIILSEICKVDIPTLYVPLCSYDAMKKITSHIAKIRNGDLAKINKAIQIVENHLDFDRLCEHAVARL